MNKFEEKFYKILINKENFYMRQYYSNFYKKEIFFAVKELKDGIYCVLISDDKNENIDYTEAIEYMKTLEKTFSLNMIIFSNEEYKYIDSSSINKLIINKDNYKVIECDKSCIPLKEIVEKYIQDNGEKIINTPKKNLQYKIPTLVIILINVIIFIITQAVIYNITNSVRASSPIISDEVINAINNSVLISFGAKYNVLIEQGQIWRLLTCAFLHSSLIHIGCNMYSLYIIGPQIQQIYGTKKYMIIYFLSCITSSLLSYFMSPNISVGASGGIFGLMGALLAFAVIERHTIQRKYISSLLQIIVLNLFIGLSIKNIDNFGHVGGLLGGILIGFIMYRIHNKKHSDNKKKS